MKKKIQSSEWAFVGSLILIMASLVVIAKVNAYKARSIVASAFPEEEENEIRVVVKGAVLEVAELSLPAGSRICDLRHKINLSDDADVAIFRRRKRLQNGEIVVVPKKTVEEKSAHCL